MSRDVNRRGDRESLRDFLVFGFKFMACLGALFVMIVLLLAGIGHFVFGI